jgi:hypothetical protein
MSKLMKTLAINFIVLLLSPHIYGQSPHPEDRAHDFESKGVGLTETLLKFSEQQHLPIAIEYVDSDSMNRPIDISLRNETIFQALDSILSHGQGYAWTLRNGIIEIKNKHSSKRAEHQLNTVIPLFKIATEEPVALASAMLWRELQVALDPSLRSQGFASHFLVSSSTVKPFTFKNHTVRQILSYIILNSRAHGWIVAGPPKCLGFTPYCGLWYVIDSACAGTSYQLVLTQVRENF